jgi:dolichol-phosphate mannosyltransferase
MDNFIAIIIPAYNERDNILSLVTRLDEVLKHSAYEYCYLFVDDGSKDDSINILKKISEEHANVSYLSFSRNFGKDHALKAGIDVCTNALAVITMDADLQHPPELIPQMVEMWVKGSDIVYTYREDANPHTSFLHRLSSRLFYKLLNFFSDIRFEEGISDFRLMDQKVVRSLAEIKEDGLFFRGLVKWVGYHQQAIPYTPDARLHGKTTYSKISLFKLAMQGIMAFSVRPLYLAVYIGFALSVISLLYVPYVIYSLYMNLSVSGWASVIMSVVFFAGMNMSILGIIGIYIGKIYMQSKERPQYIINRKNLKF